MAFEFGNFFRWVIALAIAGLVAFAAGVIGVVLGFFVGWGLWQLALILISGVGTLIFALHAINRA